MIHILMICKDHQDIYIDLCMYIYDCRMIKTHMFQMGKILTFLCFMFLVADSWASFAFMQTEIEYDGQLNIILQHALDNDSNAVFTDRGLVNIQSIRSGSVVLNQNPLSLDDRKKLKELKENDGLYRLKALVTTSGGKKITFLTFTKAASLYESHLSDIITVSLDSSGNPIAVSIAAGNFMNGGLPANDQKFQQFNTTVFVRHMEQGPTPDTAAYIQKLEQEKLARDRGETKDNRLFIAKYWMYIVPVAIFVLISSAANPEAGGAAAVAR